MSIVYLRPIGVLNAAAGSALLSQIQSELEKNATEFHLDFSGVTSIDDPGIRNLLQARQVIANAQGRLLLVSMNATVSAFFEFRGLDRVFEIEP